MVMLMVVLVMLLMELMRIVIAVAARRYCGWIWQQYGADAILASYTLQKSLQFLLGVEDHHRKR